MNALAQAAGSFSVEAFADADDIDRRLNMTPEMLQKIGSISAMAGTIEMQLELAVWALGRRIPKDAPHPLCGAPARDMAAALSRHAEENLSGELRDFVRLWAAAADPAFECRNSLLHGVVIHEGGEWVKFVRNPIYPGLRRKPKTKTRELLITDIVSMERLRLVFAILLRTMTLVRPLASAGDGATILQADRHRWALHWAHAQAHILNAEDDHADQPIEALKREASALSASSGD